MKPPAAPLPLPGRVARAARERGLLAPGDCVLVAVSGGADSTALAALLAEAGAHELPLHLVIGHVDHGWRGAREAAADRAAVEALGARLGVPVRCAPAPPADLPPTEDAARRWRYRQLSALARASGCTLVATGHHLADQAETLLMRLLRGTGLVGRAGIPRRRPLHPGLVVVRPLLDVAPEALRAWLGERGTTWREDPTNRDLSRDRARVRAWLATLTARGGDPHATLVALAEEARARLARRLETLDRELTHRFVHWPEAQAVALPRAAMHRLRGLDLRLALRRAGEFLHAERDGPWLTRRHVAVARTILQRGGDLDLPAGLALHVSGATAWLARRAPLEPRPLPCLRREDVPAGAFDLRAFLAAGDAEAAAVDAGVLGSEAHLRLLAESDGFVPYGSGGAPRPVRAWLGKQGVPALARRGQLVVEGATGIAWLVGRRIDARHAVTAHTRRVAVLRLTRPG